MKTPNEFQVGRLLAHIAADYDPAKAHDYYEHHKHLKGRRPAQVKPHTVRPSKTGLTRAQIHSAAKEKQRVELSAAISRLTSRLQKLEALIKQRESDAASENRKSTAKKERAAKEKDKPETAADKAKTARDNKQYRDSHQQKLKSASKTSSSSSKSTKSSSNKHSIEELKSLATRVLGQIAVAKKKLAAL